MVQILSNQLMCSVRDNMITHTRIEVAGCTYHADYAAAQDVLVWISWITDIENIVERTTKLSARIANNIVGQLNV